MKQLITPFLFLLSSAIVGQTATDDYYGSAAKPKLFSKDRVSVSFMAGTSVSFMSNSKTAGFTTFIAPKVNYQLTDKFRLNLGLMHYSSTGNPAMMYGRTDCFGQGSKNMSGNLVFVGGDYLLNKKVTLSGAVMMDVNGLSNKQNNYKAASFGVDYKLSNHSSIGIQATIEQGNPNYMFNPGRNSFDYNPQPTSSKYGGFLGGVAAGFGDWGVGELNTLVH